MKTIDEYEEMPMDGMVIEYLLRHYCNYTTQDFQTPMTEQQRKHSLALAQIAWIDHVSHRVDIMLKGKKDDTTVIEKYDGKLRKKRDGTMVLTFEDVENSFKSRGK